MSDEDLERFSYLEHRENVALALKVLPELEVPRQVALQGMWRAAPDPGAMTSTTARLLRPADLLRQRLRGQRSGVHRADLAHGAAAYPEVERVVAVFNLRADRPSRTVQLARDVSFWHEADHVVLMGTGAYLFARGRPRWASTRTVSSSPTTSTSTRSSRPSWACGNRRW